MFLHWADKHEDYKCKVFMKQLHNILYSGVELSNQIDSSW